MGDEKKYEFTKEKRSIDGVILRQIRAVRDVSTYVSKGDIGGWIADEASLSHSGECWVYPDAAVTGHAMVLNDATVSCNAIVQGYATVAERSGVSGKAVVKGWANIFGDAFVTDQAVVSGHAHLSGSAGVSGKARVSGDAVLLGTTTVSGDAEVSGEARFYNAWISDFATVKSPLDAITVEGFLEASFTVYRADDEPDGHVVAAGCQRFSLMAPTERLQAIARVNHWELPNGWKGLRAALLVTVRGWQREAEAQEASKKNDGEKGNEGR